MRSDEFEKHLMAMTDDDFERQLMTIVVAKYMAGITADTPTEEIFHRASEAGKAAGRVIAAAVHRGPVTEVLLPRMVVCEARIQKLVIEQATKSWGPVLERRGETLQ